MGEYTTTNSKATVALVREMYLQLEKYDGGHPLLKFMYEDREHGFSFSPEPCLRETFRDTFAPPGTKALQMLKNYLGELTSVVEGIEAKDITPSHQVVEAPPLEEIVEEVVH